MGEYSSQQLLDWWRQAPDVWPIWFSAMVQVEAPGSSVYFFERPIYRGSATPVVPDNACQMQSAHRHQHRCSCFAGEMLPPTTDYWQNVWRPVYTGIPSLPKLYKGCTSAEEGVHV